MIVVYLLFFLWITKFLRISYRMDTRSQHNKTWTTTFSSTGSILVASRLSPKIMPTKIMKKIVSIRPSYKLMIESGRNTKINIPYTTLSMPKPR